eukprot:6969215-Pyramimonas_sp.AAC.1
MPRPFGHGWSTGPRLTAWSTTGCSRGFVERTGTATLDHGPGEARCIAEHHALPVHAFRPRGSFSFGRTTPSTTASPQASSG